VKREILERNINPGEGYFGQRNVAFLFSIASLFHDARLLLAVGLVLALRELHSAVSVWGRTVAQSIGERILEAPRTFLRS